MADGAGAVPFKPLLKASFVKLVPTFQRTRIFGFEYFVAYFT